MKPALKRSLPIEGAPLSVRSGEDNAAERQRAVRTLLRRPLLCAGGDENEDFANVRRHAEALRVFFSLPFGIVCLTRKRPIS